MGEHGEEPQGRGSGGAKRKEQLKPGEEAVKEQKGVLAAARAEVGGAVEDFNEARKRGPGERATMGPARVRRWRKR